MKYGFFSGILWGLDTVILGVFLTYTTAMPINKIIVIAPFISTFLHDFFSATWMILFTLLRGQISKLVTAFKTRNGKVIMIGAILGGPIGMTGYILSIGHIGAGYTAVISSIYPAFGALLAYFFLKQRFRLRQWLGLFIAIGAIIALSYTSSYSVSNFSYGIALAMLSVLGWAGEGVICAYGMRDEEVGDEQAIIIRQLTSAGIFALIILPIARVWDQTIIVSSNLSIMFYVILAALAGGFSYLFYYRSIHRIGVGKSMALNITYSTWAIGFDYLILGNKPNLISLFLCGVIIIGAIVAAYEKDTVEYVD